MNKECYNPNKNDFTKDEKCNAAHIESDDTITCMLGSIIWKIMNRKVGWHCDWEKPRNNL